MSALTYYTKEGCIRKTFHPFSSIRDITSQLFEFGVPWCVDHYFIINGHLLQDPDYIIPKGSHVHAVPRIIGGKGGFGSMLRAIGAQIEKTTSREACRDLSGRRMRDVNNEKKLKEWIGKEADREKERAQRRYERMERRRNQPKHNFEDETYHEHRIKISDNLEDALQEGLNKKKSSKASATVTQSTVSRKRISDEPVPGSSKKKCEWIGIDLEDASDLDTDEDSNSDSERGARASPILSLDSESTSSSLFESNTFTSVTTTSCASTDSESASKEQNDLPHSSNRCCDRVEMDNSNDDIGSCETNIEKTITDNSNSGLDSMLDVSEIKSSEQKIGENSAVADLKSSETLQSNECSAKNIASESQGLLSMLKNIAPEENKSSPQVTGPIDLEEYQSTSELEDLGLEVLKFELMSRGMKCGGTCQQRAERLFSVKGLKPEQIPSSLSAKPTTGKGGKKNKF